MINYLINYTLTEKYSDINIYWIILSMICVLGIYVWRMMDWRKMING
jgi:hypothetical protein